MYNRNIVFRMTRVSQNDELSCKQRIVTQEVYIAGGQLLISPYKSSNFLRFELPPKFIVATDLKVVPICLSYSFHLWRSQNHKYYI